jgi:hypothetical protein
VAARFSLSSSSPMKLVELTAPGGPPSLSPFLRRFFCSAFLLR